jgi:hypothetical protein
VVDLRSADFVAAAIAVAGAAATSVVVAGIETQAQFQHRSGRGRRRCAALPVRPAALSAIAAAERAASPAA